MEVSPSTPYLTASHDEYHEQSPNCAEKDTKAQRAQAEHFLAHACSVRTPAHEPRWPLSQSPPSSVWPQYPTRDSLKRMVPDRASVACNRRPAATRVPDVLGTKAIGVVGGEGCAEQCARLPDAGYRAEQAVC